MNRQRAGLSEVIAALLILVIAVAIGTIFFAWGTTVLGLTESGFIQQTALSRDKIEERITVTSIFNVTEDDPDLGDDSLYIAVFNYGRRTATLATVYVNTTAYDYDSGEFEIRDSDRTTILSSNEISVGKLVWVRINDLDLEKDKMSTVTLATERGNSYELLFEA